MMDERKLDINAPLMSVRRSSAASPSLTEAKMKVLEKRYTFPNYKSDMTLDQVTEPVAVPFNWEHIPGMPKGDGGSQPQPIKEASITPIPSLPPGKYTSVPKQPLEKECNDANKFTPSNKSNSLIGSVSKIDCGKERKDEKIRSNVVESDDDDDDVYSDALDTLSSTESLYMNCSAGGVSGLDNLDANKSGTNATDRQTQEFMMTRFLPAAKAMTFHPPQYASSRKKSVLVEQPRDVIRLVREERKSTVKKHITDIVPYTGQCQEEEEEESSDEADDYAESTNVSAKGCGMFPHLRARNSLCLLNPVPGMKMRNQFAMSPAYEYGRSNKRSHTPAIKKAWDAIHKSKSSSGAASPDMHEVRKKWTSESNRFTYSGEMKPQGRLSPFRRSGAAATAAATSTFQSKPQPLFPRARLHCDSKQAESNQSGILRFQSRRHGSIQDVLSNRSSSSRSLAIEKTLYIDTASTPRLSCSNSCSEDKTKRVGAMVAVLDKRKGKGESSMITESFQDTKNQLALEEKLDSEVLASGQEDKDEKSTTEQETSQESMSLQLVRSSHDKDHTKTNNKQIVVVNHPAKVGSELVVSPLPPPLPKSPSDSWLSRALPLVYMKKPFLHSYQDTQSLSKRQGFNASSRYTKWETIVKTSNLHHGHVSCSKEITIYKPQHSKS